MTRRAGLERRATPKSLEVWCEIWPQSVALQTLPSRAVVRGAYLRILNRVPLPVESRDAAAFLDAFGGADPAPAAAALCQTLFASAEFLYVY